MYCSRYLEGLVAKNLHCNADFLAVFGIFGFAQKLPTKQKLGPSSTFSASRLQREQLHSKPAESTCQLRFTSDRVDPVQHAQVMPTVLFRKAPLFSKVTPKSCLRGFPASHHDHCSTHLIDVVSKCSPSSLLPSFFCFPSSTATVGTNGPEPYRKLYDLYVICQGGDHSM